MIWQLSHRFDAECLPLADRHYNRRKVGSPQFVPPGRCVVLKSDGALWVTSWPFAEFVKHAWPGAWVNSLFRREHAQGKASEMIREAVAATRAIWEPPTEGLVTFIDPQKVTPTIMRGHPTFGYSYIKAGFDYVGTTRGGLLAFLMRPSQMPAPDAPIDFIGELFALRETPSPPEPQEQEQG